MNCIYKQNAEFAFIYYKNQVRISFDTLVIYVKTFVNITVAFYGITIQVFAIDYKH